MGLEYYFLMVFVALVFGFANKSYKRYKRKNHEILTFNDVIQSNKKFVLFLRSFEDDGKSKEMPVSLFTLSIQAPTFEEQISKDFKNFNLVAVGRPKEELPELGANRLYISNELWKEQVSLLIDKASIIIVKPSFTEGLSWELETIINKCLLSKIVLFHLFKDVSDKKLQNFYYDEFKELMSKSFNVKMQPFLANSIYSYFQKNLTHIQVKRLKEIPFIEYVNEKNAL